MVDHPEVNVQIMQFMKTFGLHTHHIVWMRILIQNKKKTIQNNKKV